VSGKSILDNTELGSYSEEFKAIQQMDEEMWPQTIGGWLVWEKSFWYLI